MTSAQMKTPKKPRVVQTRMNPKSTNEDLVLGAMPGAAVALVVAPEVVQIMTTTAEDQITKGRRLQCRKPELTWRFRESSQI